MGSLDRFCIGYSVPKGLGISTSRGADAFRFWLRAFELARSSIDLGQFYICSSPESSADKLIASLLQASARGVRVRLMIDRAFWRHNLETGDPTYIAPIEVLRGARNVSVRYNKTYNQRGGSHHAKYFIVDHSVAWVGSQNFDWKSLEHIFEIGVLFDNASLVNDVRCVFENDWGLHSGSSPNFLHQLSNNWAKVTYKRAEHRARVTASPDTTATKMGSCAIDGIVSFVDQARKCIEIQARKFEGDSLSKFEDWTRFLQSVRYASKRGVLVRLLLDSREKEREQRMEHVLKFTHGTNIEVKFLRVPSYSSHDPKYSRMLHSKSITIDDNFTWIGSSNLTDTDFCVSRNLGVEVIGRQFCLDVATAFNTCWSSRLSEGA